MWYSYMEEFKVFRGGGNMDDISFSTNQLKKKIRICQVNNSSASRGLKFLWLVSYYITSSLVKDTKVLKVN